MPFLLTVRLAADDGHPTPLRQARVTAYALKQPVVLKSDGTQLVHQPESALTDDTGHATLTLYRSSEVLTPSDWAVTIDGVTWSGPVPETPDTASSILEMVESYGWGIIAAPKSAPVVAITGPAGATGPAGPTIDGLATDGAQGAAVTGHVAIDGAPTNTPAKFSITNDNDTSSPYNSQFYVGGNGELYVVVDDATIASSAAYIARNHPAHGPYGGPLVKFVDFSAENQYLLWLESHAVGGATTGAFYVGKEGGVGMFQHAVMTAPRTLAQSVIDAITDANAKTATQAIANALSDMGALTLT